MPYFTMFCFTQVSLFWLSTQLYFWPKADYMEQVKLCFNEFTVLLISYHLYCFTEFTEVSMRQGPVGNSIILAVIVSISLNVLFYILPQAIKLQLKCKKRYLILKRGWKRILLRARRLLHV